MKTFEDLLAQLDEKTRAIFEDAMIEAAEELMTESGEIGEQLKKLLES